MPVSAQDIIHRMEARRDETQRHHLMRFFKTAPGDYGYGDEFLGLPVPTTRSLVKGMAHELPLEEVPVLLASKWHEVRLTGLLTLVDKFERLASRRLTNDEESIRSRDAVVAMYLRHADSANNWDLVDLSAPKLLGHWLLLPTRLGDKRQTIDQLAASDSLWRQRMSIVCTWKTSAAGDPSWCLRYAEWHLHHPHDLMHKAVGWMLREMGKRCGLDVLREFLQQHGKEMPRTMLRYAIEKMDDKERHYWMSVTKSTKN